MGKLIIEMNQPNTIQPAHPVAHFISGGSPTIEENMPNTGNEKPKIAAIIFITQRGNLILFLSRFFVRMTWIIGVTIINNNAEIPNKISISLSNIAVF